MENLDRKDIRLLSSLTDLKLENIKSESHTEEVSFVLALREKGRHVKWGH